MTTFPHVITLTSPGNKFALTERHAQEVREWMAQHLNQSYSLEPIAPAPVGFQAGGVVRFACDVEAFYFHVKWSELVTRYCVYDQAA